jgi:peroxiredoxin family protein
MRAEGPSGYMLGAAAAAAAARGGQVEIALFFDALARWVREEWDDISEAGPFAQEAASTGAPRLSELLAEGRREGAIKIYGCSASARWGGLELTAVERRVDALMGWTSFVGRMEEAETVLCV